MSMKMMNAAYLVDNVALLSLQEKQDGVEFHCFDMNSKVQTAEGRIGWGDGGAGTDSVSIHDGRLGGKTAENRTRRVRQRCLYGRNQQHGQRTC